MCCQVFRIRGELRKRKMHYVSVERVFNVQGIFVLTQSETPYSLEKLDMSVNKIDIYEVYL